MERRPNRDCASDAQNDRSYELFCCLFHNQMIAGRVTSQKMVFQILSDEWERAETSVAFWGLGRGPALALALRFLFRCGDSTVTLDDELNVVTGFIVRRNGIAIFDDRVLSCVITCQR